MAPLVQFLDDGFEEALSGNELPKAKWDVRFGTFNGLCGRLGTGRECACGARNVDEPPFIDDRWPDWGC